MVKILSRSSRFSQIQRIKSLEAPLRINDWINDWINDHRFRARLDKSILANAFLKIPYLPVRS